MKYRWRKIDDKPKRPTSALIAFISADGEGTLTDFVASCGADGVFKFEVSGYPVPSDLYWLDEDALFSAYPLRAKWSTKRSA